MDGLNYPEFDESFLNEPSKVVELIETLDVMVNSNKMEDKREGKKKKEPQTSFADISADVTDDSFFITSRGRSQNLGRRSTRRTRSRSKALANLNQFTFMRQIDQTLEQRTQTRIERERVANNFRRLGNSAYRKEQFSNAIEMYTRGLEYIKDTPVLYINRACCYLKLRNFNLAIIECNNILTKLDPKYLRAFLYRAIAYKRLNDEKNYEESIYQAKRLNSREMEFIDDFLEKMRTF
ncbi:tetratricopeptide repeat protein 12 [Drosophila innubila]|uniref:tetratricopeptide repeat protein 12 n=1 Tax=Drosophila innubila TaxID=198719 RepID=UPI00148C9076|nr:tetratricopeptide repeat protein 12 [Drosophila innubila]